MNPIDSEIPQVGTDVLVETFPSPIYNNFKNQFESIAIFSSGINNFLCFQVFPSCCPKLSQVIAIRSS